MNTTTNTTTTTNTVYTVQLPFYVEDAPNWFKNFINSHHDEFLKESTTDRGIWHAVEVKLNEQGIKLRSDLDRWVNVLAFESEEAFALFVLKWE